MAGSRVFRAVVRVRFATARRGSEHEPCFDFVSAAHRRVEQVPAYEGTGGHGPADHDSAGRHRIARGSVG